jgi:hypothetical protein
VIPQVAGGLTLVFKGVKIRAEKLVIKKGSVGEGK